MLSRWVAQSRRFIIVTLATAAVIALPGCSIFENELSNRGGYLDTKLDTYWWAADTKPMRVLRAYSLIGSVARLAQIKHDSERAAIVQQVGIAVQVASDAYNCAYTQPGRCVFFDERMVELEVAVLRLLSVVLSSQDEADLMKALNNQISQTIPLLKGFDSLSKLVDAATSTGELATNLTKIISSVFTFGQNAYFTGRRIGAVYRDTIELQMVTVLGSLDAMCAIKKQMFIEYDANKHQYKTLPVRSALESDKLDNERWAILNFYGSPSEMPDGVCEAFQRGLKLWERGAGTLSEWSAFLDKDARRFSVKIIPSEESFVQASDLIWRACEHISSKDDERSVCIGRNRNIPAGSPSAMGECAVDVLTKPAAEQEEVAAGTEKRANEQKQSGKGAPAKAVKTTTISEKAANKDRWCRLIQYSKVVGLRSERVNLGRASARHHWLSNLTPSISHPPHRHPGQWVTLGPQSVPAVAARNRP